MLEDLERRLSPNFDPLGAWKGNLQGVAQATGDHLQQRWWTDALGKRVMHELLDVVEPRDQVRLLEQATGVGHAFMAVQPSLPLHFSFPSDQYRVGLKWWLGLPLFVSSEGALCPGCSAPVDQFGDHLVCCKRNNFSRRHNAVQESLGALLQEAGQGWAKEVPLPDPLDAAMRPADLLIRGWIEGKDTAVDLTVSHGWQVAGRPEGRASRERWRAFLRKKEAEKLD